MIDGNTKMTRLLWSYSFSCIHDRSPHVAVITNLSPNHLDYHTSMNEYVDAKKSIYLYQGTQDRLVLNYDNSLTRELAQQASSKVTWFSRTTDLPYGAVYKEGKLCFAEDGVLHELVDRSEVKLPGDHNVENYPCCYSCHMGLCYPRNHP
jgi:UDP-N-acetylmuramoylalanine--D-glutamate ligase